MQISANKKRVPIIVIIGLTLIVLLTMAIANAKDSENVNSHQSLYIYIGLMISCVYFTSLSFADYWKTLFDTRAILSIDQNGIFDNLSIFSCGNIQWGQISDVEVRQALKTNFLIIHVRNSDDLIARQSKWKQRMLKGFQKKFGSPVVISQKRVKDNVESIKKVIAEYLHRPTAANNDFQSK